MWPHLITAKARRYSHKVSQVYVQLKFGGMWRNLILKSRREWILEKNYEKSYHIVGRNKEAFFMT